MLKSKKDQIVDHLAYNETMHRLYIKIGDKEKAIDHLEYNI